MKIIESSAFQISFKIYDTKVGYCVCSITPQMLPNEFSLIILSESGLTILGQFQDNWQCDTTVLFEKFRDDA